MTIEEVCRARGGDGMARRGEADSDTSEMASLLDVDFFSFILLLPTQSDFVSFLEML